MTEFLTDFRHYILLLHIFGTTLGLGGAIVTDILFMRFLKDFRVSMEEKEVLDTLSLVIWSGLGILVVTGIGLFWPHYSLLLQTPSFVMKMVIVGVILINGLILNFYVSPKLTSMVFNDPVANGANINTARKLSPIFGGVSIVSWASAFFLGAMSSYIDYSFKTLLEIYLLLLAAGIFGSLAMTRYKFGKKIN